MKTYFQYKTTVLRIFLLIAMLIPSASMMSSPRDSIGVSQFVKNSFTKYGVRNALVTVMDSAGNVIDTVRTQPGSGGHDAQVWMLTVPRRKATFRIRVEHPEYETGEMTVEIKYLARLDNYRFPDMLLKRKFAEKSVNLSGVTVRATRVKLCYKGDTIEVDARAFKLTEGSMLESLVKNIPGCELRDNGDIYMNGRKVDYLTLNGKDFFKGNNRIMLDNLPYYTVDKLQFYNQRSERSQLAGKDLDRPDYVMNVKLKQEYNIGYLGNVEAGAGTHERWLGRAFGLRFTDNSRISLFGNANNLNDMSRPGDKGLAAQVDNPVGDTKTYNVGGEWLTDDKQGRYKEVLNATFLWNKARNKQHTTSQQFLQQGDIYGYNSSSSTQYGMNVKASNHLTLKRIGLISDSRFNYTHYDRDALSRSALFSGRPQGSMTQILDSIFSSTQSDEMLDILVNKVRDEARNKGHQWLAEQTFDYHKSLPWGDDLMLTASGQWKGTSEDGSSHYQLNYANGETPDDIQERLTKGSTHDYNLFAKAQYALHLLSGWHINVSMGHRQQHSRLRKDLYRLDWSEDYQPGETLPSMIDYLSLRDAANSPHSISNSREELFESSLSRHDYDSKRGRYFNFNASFRASYVNQEAVFSRGDAHARPSDNRWLLNPSVDVEYQTRGWHDIYNLHYDMTMRSPNLEQMADLTDTSNPLAVQMGNPRLRHSTVHNLSLMFSTRFGTHGQFLMLQSSTAIMHNLTAMNSIYNSSTGAYTYKPVNVNGNWNFNSSLEMRRALTEDRRLNIESRTAYDYIHSVDMKDSTRSTVKQHVVGENLKLEYKLQPLTVTLLGGITWHGMRLKSADNTNNVDFNYGAIFQASLPWHLHLSTDIKMYSRRGYADRSLCTDDLLWNAQLDRAFCRERLLAAVKAFDLLHEISSTHTTFNAQGRTETWQLSLPSYFMFSVQYKFNKNPKKKQ